MSDRIWILTQACQSPKSMNHCLPAPPLSAQRTPRLRLGCHLRFPGLSVPRESSRIELTPASKGRVHCGLRLCVSSDFFICKYLQIQVCRILCWFFFFNKIVISYTTVSWFFHLIMFNELLFPQCLESVLQMVLPERRERTFPFSPVSKAHSLLWMIMLQEQSHKVSLQFRWLYPIHASGLRW